MAKKTPGNGGNDVGDPNDTQEKDVQPTQRTCGTMDVHQRLLRTAPGYREARDASENQALRAAIFPAAGRTGCTKIPVVVHVVSKTAAQNISDAQIKSQIDVLTADFRRKNSDIGSVPAAFAPLTADARIEFELAKTDPSGNPTTGITRTTTTVTAFTDDDAVKSAASGGADAWPADKYLNIWVCQLGGGLLGYAQFPGGPAATDGVVIRHSAFGTTGTAAAPFNLGRTATHEVGHWLNLRHIWGDDGTGCAGSDLVADTPNQGGANTGTPAFPHVSCGNGPNGDMFMNYMDYTDDVAMMMFSAGQVTRMQATLDGLRASIGTSIPCGKALPKEIVKEPPKEFVKEHPKEFVKEIPKEFVKEHPKDFPKELPKDRPKDWPKEPVKEFPKEWVKELAKDPGLEPGKNIVADLPPKSVADPPKSFMEPPFEFPFPEGGIPGQIGGQGVGGGLFGGAGAGGPGTGGGGSFGMGGGSFGMGAGGFGGGGMMSGGGMPFVLATGAGAAPRAAGREQTVALAGAYLQLLAHYTRLHAMGQLDQSGMNAWQEAVAAYQRIIGS
jgi:uncharacterized membrane protein YgcG